MTNRSTIVKMIFGSTLYGLNTFQSDTDYKGIFLPTSRDLILSKIPKQFQESTGSQHSKNSREDVDLEMYSLHFFLKMAYEGQTVVLDMLHAPPNMIIESSEIWKYIVTNRHLFYTKNLKAFVGYARQQAAKYGIKGSRLAAAKKILDYFNSFSCKLFYLNPPQTLSDVWDDIPEGEHIYKYKPSPQNNNLRVLEVCGKKIQETAKLKYAFDIIDRFYQQYGERAKKAARNEGIDWKAVSHAMRAAFEVREILKKKTITFPLIDRDFLLQVKKGDLDYLTQVAPVLEDLMDEVENLTKISDLPSKVNQTFWEDFLMNIYKGKIKV